jgi:hypothetical protein
MNFPIINHFLKRNLLDVHKINCNPIYMDPQRANCSWIRIGPNPWYCPTSWVPEKETCLRHMQWCLFYYSIPMDLPVFVLFISMMKQMWNIKIIIFSTPYQQITWRYYWLDMKNYDLHTQLLWFILWIVSREKPARQVDCCM